MSVYTCMAARRSGSGASSREDHSAAEARWRGARLVVGDVFRCLSWLSNSASSQRERPIRQFYGSPSTFLWDDDFGEVHHVHQGEGGEQGDPLMPMLFSLGHLRALVAVQSKLLDEKLFAFLDDVYVICRPSRVQEVFQLLETELRSRASISIHLGKTKLWNASGTHRGGKSLCSSEDA